MERKVINKVTVQNCSKSLHTGFLGGEVPEVSRSPNNPATSGRNREQNTWGSWLQSIWLLQLWKFRHLECFLSRLPGRVWSLNIDHRLHYVFVWHRLKVLRNFVRMWTVLAVALNHLNEVVMLGPTPHHHVLRVAALLAPVLKESACLGCLCCKFWCTLGITFGWGRWPAMGSEVRVPVVALFSAFPLDWGYYGDILSCSNWYSSANFFVVCGESVRKTISCQMRFQLVNNHSGCHGHQYIQLKEKRIAVSCRQVLGTLVVGTVELK